MSVNVMTASRIDFVIISSMVKFHRFESIYLKSSSHPSLFFYVNRQQDADTSEVGSTTINSSVYHGESEREIGAQDDQCDATATRSAVTRSKLIPKAAGALSSALLLEDVLVGHELGEKPLLADDELDDDRISSSLTSEKSILRLLITFSSFLKYYI